MRRSLRATIVLVCAGLGEIGAFAPAAEAVRLTGAPPAADVVPRPAERGRPEALALTVRTGVAFRELGAAGRTSLATSLVVPCRATRLAPGQAAYLYLGGVAPDRSGRLRPTEMGLQLNAPPAGGTPASVQLFARSAFASAGLGAGARPHLRCDRPVRLAFTGLGTRLVSLAASGDAVPGGRFVLTGSLSGIRPDPSGRRCRIVRVTTLAVRDGAPTRPGARFGVTLDRVDPARPPSSLSPSLDVPVAVDERGASTRVEIDERGAT